MVETWLATALYCAVKLCHGKYRTEQSTMQPKDRSDEENFLFSVCAQIVLLLLQAGAHLNDTRLGAYLKSSHSDTLDDPILKMLSAAGADIGDPDCNTEENINLKALTGNFIRRYLKQNHPESNLYHTVTQLHEQLPQVLQSYLLLDMLPKGKKDLNDNVQEFFSKVSKNDIEGAKSSIKDGVDVDVTDEQDKTALMIVSEAGQVEFIEALRLWGARLNDQSPLGDTALILATENNRKDCVKKIIAIWS